MAKAILIIGGTGRGKSTFTKKILKDITTKKYIYDVNNEHNNNEIKNFPEIESFLNTVKNKINSCVVIEEATIFFNNRGYNEILCSMLVRKRHTNNIIILLFHSLRSVPVYIMDLCNYVVLFKTNDNPKKVNEKFKDFDKIVKEYHKVNTSPDFHIHSIIKLDN